MQSHKSGDIFSFTKLSWLIYFLSQSLATLTILSMKISSSFSSSSESAGEEGESTGSDAASSTKGRDCDCDEPFDLRYFTVFQASLRLVRKLIFLENDSQYSSLISRFRFLKTPVKRFSSGTAVGDALLLRTSFRAAFFCAFRSESSGVHQAFHGLSSFFLFFHLSSHFSIATNFRYFRLKETY